VQNFPEENEFFKKINSTDPLIRIITFLGGEGFHRSRVDTYLLKRSTLFF